MKKFILGTKQYMTQIFDDAGAAHPATVLSAGPVTITQLKNAERDGYSAVQVGYEEQSKKNMPKAKLGHLKDLNLLRHLREFRLSPDGKETYKRGDTINVSIFTPGDVVEVSAVSKGKGFQGVVKRHGFHGGPRTHGQKHSEREPGSIGGAGRAGGRVAKGMRMAGRMGGDRVTVKNLKVLQVDTEHNRIVLRGAVPGRRGTLVEIRVK
ncbi:50S ribosomal protein L3 [Candidatus Kaiserbacteria bacterium]|nr:50S ribosomal protein L3 [Candidatus Kaiserbacteria bacterium]